MKVSNDKIEKWLDRTIIILFFAFIVFLILLQFQWFTNFIGWLTWEVLEWKK